MLVDDHGFIVNTIEFSSFLESYCKKQEPKDIEQLVLYRSIKNIGIENTRAERLKTGQIRIFILSEEKKAA